MASPMGSSLFSQAPSPLCSQPQALIQASTLRTSWEAARHHTKVLPTEARHWGLSSGSVALVSPCPSACRERAEPPKRFSSKGALNKEKASCDSGGRMTLHCTSLGWARAQGLQFFPGHSDASALPTPNPRMRMSGSDGLQPLSSPGCILETAVA